MRNKLIPVAAGGIAVAVLSVAVIAGVANARPSEQQPTPTPTPSARQQQAQQRAEEFIDRLARNLGITPDKLKDGLKQTALQEVDRAQAENRITAEQAQRLKDRINAGTVGPLGFGGIGGIGRIGAGKAGIGPFGVARDQLAQFLGITAQQLNDELNGKSLAQVAQAHGKTAEQLKQFIITNAEQRFAQAVKDGKMTQQQADRALQALKDHVDDLINGVRHAGRGPNRNR